MHRLFIGIRPPEPVRDALVDVMEGVEGARWQYDEQLHLTLRFLGEVERPVANELAGALQRVGWPRFALRIEGVGVFERKGRFGSSPHALWARVPASEALEGLRHKIERACEYAGLERETRRFTPHITLARLNRQSGQIGGWLSTFSDLATGPWPVDEFVLYESHLGHEGAHYEPVAIYPLAG